MRQNPLADWEATRTASLERLRGENQAFVKRLKEGEAALKEVQDVTPSRAVETDPAGAGGGGSTLVPRESYEVALKEKNELEHELKQKDVRLARLQEVIFRLSSLGPHQLNMFISFRSSE